MQQINFRPEKYIYIYVMYALHVVIGLFRTSLLKTSTRAYHMDKVEQKMLKYNLSLVGRSNEFLFSSLFHHAFHPFASVPSSRATTVLFIGQSRSTVQVSTP